MPRTLDSKFHLDNIVDQYGADLDADKVKAYCSNHEVGYQTITKYLNQYKTKRGHWKVTVKQAKKQLEKAISSPPVNVGISKTTAAVNTQSLVPEKDATFVRFGAFND